MKISVIIAMFNAEKYIGDCLDSLLAQTFQDFEVIVVDDCSTDNSNAIVKSYAEKFGGRLKLCRLPKNSGNNGVPNKKGLAFSRGEYVTFIDSDDALTPTALQELYSLAKKFDADVIACEKYFAVPEKSWHELKLGKIFQLTSYPSINLVNEPTLVPFDIVERVRACYERKFLWPMWSKLMRRDLLIANEIPFPNNITHDVVTTCCIAYSAEKFLRVPNVVYYYRVREGSMSHNTDDRIKYIRKYLHALTTGFNHFEKFLSGREFFNQHLDLKNFALETYVGEICAYFDGIYRDVPAHAIDEILAQEFSKNPSATLTAFLFSSMNFYRLKFFDALRRTTG